MSTVEIPAGLLADKVVIVTGAARGMGEATARVAAAGGAGVVLADLDEAGASAVASSIESSGGRAFALRVDVGDEASVQAMVAAAVDRFGRLDGAVNNAARSPDTKPLVDLDKAEFESVLAIDLTGMALCLKHELRALQAVGHGGSLVNVASVSSFRPQPNNAAYVAAKHGVLGLTKVAALESAPHGIRVNSVAPGAIDTPMLRGALGAVDADAEREIALGFSLFGRFGLPEEVARASAWLLSDQSSYATGTNVTIDGGFTAR